MHLSDGNAPSGTLKFPAYSSVRGQILHVKFFFLWKKKLLKSHRQNTTTTILRYVVDDNLLEFIFITFSQFELSTRATPSGFCSHHSLSNPLISHHKPVRLECPKTRTNLFNWQFSKDILSLTLFSYTYILN